MKNEVWDFQQRRLRMSVLSHPDVEISEAPSADRVGRLVTTRREIPHRPEYARRWSARKRAIVFFFASLRQLPRVRRIGRNRPPNK